MNTASSVVKSVINSVIKVENLCRNYGSVRAVDNVNFEINRGEIVGLLGRNGAGKTTCLRMLTGLLLPSAGRIFINNIDITENPTEARSAIGFLPEQPALYPELTVFQYLQFIARLRGVSREDFKPVFESILTKTGLENVDNFIIRNLSLGYKKRVGIAQTLIGATDLLVFDEPISGLDPHQIVEMRNLLRELGKDHTIILSSHILTEVSRTCDRVMILEKGKMIAELKGDQLNDLEDRFLQLTNAV
ncbi:MAG: ABC transporter ATP-binding protein [Leptonema sp. (in: Bacteria)]|nr:ABC transporter ATP-binding protein [Leptonema sp. (in: bacteria)]